MAQNNSKRRGAWLLWLVPVVALIALITWRIWQKKAEAAQGAKATAARKNAAQNVDAVKVTRRDIVLYFDGVGSLEAPATVQVSPRVTGRLLDLLVREGDPVKRGQVLARIDPLELQSAIRQKEAALAAARSRLAEARVTVTSQGVGVSSAIQQQQAALLTAQAQSNQARADFAAGIAAAEAAVTAAAERVTAADALVRSADADIVSAKASVANAESLYNRQAALLTKGFVSEQVAQTSRTEVQVARAELNAAQARKANAVATRDAAVATRKASEKQVTIARNKAAADVALAGASLAQTRATLRAAQAGTAQNAAIQENIAALSAAVAGAQADLQAARTQVADLTLRSPLDGLVATRQAEPGAVVSPSTPIVSVQSVRKLWATVGVPEETARRLSPNQTATVTLDALPGETFHGLIERILPAADPQSRQFTVRVALDNGQNRLRPGTFARVRLVTQKAPGVLTVPPEAVKEAKGEQYVLVVGADGTAQKRTVKTGLSDAKGVAVSGDLSENDSVIVLSQRDVKDGQKIRTAQKKGDAGAGKTGADDDKTSAKENAR